MAKSTGSFLKKQKFDMAESMQGLEFRGSGYKSLRWNCQKVLKVCWGTILAEIEENCLHLSLTKKGAFESQVPNLDLGDYYSGVEPRNFWEKHKFKQNLDKL